MMAAAVEEAVAALLGIPAMPGLHEVPMDQARNHQATTTLLTNLRVAEWQRTTFRSST